MSLDLFTFWTSTDCFRTQNSVEIVVNDPQALLIFSGGQTRATHQTTESESYLRIAEDVDMYSQLSPDTPPKPFPRATTEDFALDSYENLVFSVARFKE